MKITLQLNEAEILGAVFNAVINKACSVGEIDREAVKIELARNSESGEFVANIYASEDIK